MSCQHGISAEALFPHLAGVVIEAAVLGGGLVLHARARAGQAACTRCGQVSGRVHSRYARRLADVPAGGRPAAIVLRVRRFFCRNAGCDAVTFAEQVPGLTSPHSRRTAPLAAMLAAVAVALAGRAGARLAAALGLPASRWGLLRLVMAQPDPETGTVQVLAVDDFAFLRGRRYGTVLVDAGTGRPVDLLPGREAGPLADWLREHPGTAVICRDRAGAYADGARQGAPDAIQAADRWHIWHNLCQHAEKTAARHRGCLAGPAPEDPGTAQAARDTAFARAVRERHAQVRELREQRHGIKAIAAHTGLALQTVRRYCHAGSAEELLAVILDGPPSPLDAHKPYLDQRWDEGCRNARQLHAEIRDRGYPGGYSPVAAYLRPRRRTPALPAAPPAPPKVRDITRQILTAPASLDQEDKAQLARARQQCPHLDSLARHVTEFAEILTGLHGDRLDAWIEAVEADDQPDLHSFARGLRRDHDAVRTGLTRPFNSGVAEGTVNKIKMLKRQMYGRAGFPLLRKRVLLAT